MPGGGQDPRLHCRGAQGAGFCRKLLSGHSQLGEDCALTRAAGQAPSSDLASCASAKPAMPQLTHGVRNRDSRAAGEASADSSLVHPSAHQSLQTITDLEDKFEPPTMAIQEKWRFIPIAGGHNGWLLCGLGDAALHPHCGWAQQVAAVRAASGSGCHLGEVALHPHCGWLHRRLRMPCLLPWHAGALGRWGTAYPCATPIGLQPACHIHVVTCSICP